MRTFVLLSVGSDPDLMKTRSLVLLKAGYTLRDAMTIDEALTLFKQGDYDLVVICHSIPEPERLKLITAIRASSPSAKIVVIRKDGELSAKVADETVHSLDGPEALLKTVAHSLGNPSPKNKRPPPHRANDGCP
jgi:DNA-binding NtrC family response regulator